jgi:hypothetical protein
MGKSDGDGVTGTVARILEKIDATEIRIRELRALTETYLDGAGLFAYEPAFRI